MQFSNRFFNKKKPGHIQEYLMPISCSMLCIYCESENRHVSSNEGTIYFVSNLTNQQLGKIDKVTIAFSLLPEL